MTPTSDSDDSQDGLLVDTSVAVALVVADHHDHDLVTSRLEGAHLGLAGHAAFETFSVLTRMPAPLRRTPQAVERLLSVNFPASRFLDADATWSLLGRLPELGITGGAVYDALVGAVAAHHSMRLVSRDRGAMRTYRALEIDFEILGSPP